MKNVSSGSYKKPAHDTRNNWVTMEFNTKCRYNCLRKQSHIDNCTKVFRELELFGFEFGQFEFPVINHLFKKWVDEEKTIYGITTGFGALSDVVISKKDTRRLQGNILKSHAAGVGEPMDEETVRAVMALRIKDLARGHSGIRLETVQH